MANMIIGQISRLIAVRISLLGCCIKEEPYRNSCVNDVVRWITHISSLNLPLDGVFDVLSEVMLPPALVLLRYPSFAVVEFQYTIQIRVVDSFSDFFLILCNRYEITIVFVLFLLRQ